jgi:hypothetical protein
MANTSSKLGLEFILASQADKHVSYNQAMAILDVMVQLTVKNRTTSVPPASPTIGQSWIIATASTGSWLGLTGHIAVWSDSGWMFIPPKIGLRAWITDEKVLLVYVDGIWKPALSDEQVDKFGIGTGATVSDVLTVSGGSSLYTSAQGSHRTKINRATDNDTASLSFQTGFSTRAELGYSADEKFRIKTSTNGSSFSNAIVVDPVTTRVGIGVNSPLDTLHVQGGLRLNDNAGAIMFYDFAGSTRTGYFQAHKTAGFYFNMELAQPMFFYTANQLRLFIGSDGKIGVGGIATPTAPLHVNGAMRVGSVSKAALPSASAIGSGGLIYVSDEIGGSTLACSDGTNWRRMSDRAIIS